MESDINIRPAVVENVTKMLHCGNMKYGYAFMLVSIAVNLKSFLSTVKSDFVLLAATDILYAELML